MNYKYTIHTRLRKLSVNDYEVALELLPKLCRIHKQTFRNWIYIKKDDERDIPATALIIIAGFFGCDPSDIFSEKPQTTTFKQILSNVPISE